MPLPTCKDELLRNLDLAYSRLIDEIAAIPAALEREPAIEGGISLCDLIAYQIGWSGLLLSWESQEREGRAAQMPAPGFKWNQLGLLADSFYREFQPCSREQLLALFADRVARIRGFIEASDEADLFRLGARRWAADKWPVVKWIQVNTIAPYTSARAKLRKWRKSVQNV